MLEDEEARAQRAAAWRRSTGAACACCGARRQADAPLCLACTLLADADETDDSERWNYPEQLSDHD